MKSDAKIADKFKDFKPNLSDRKNIILGMGLRGFEKLFSLKNYNLLNESYVNFTSFPSSGFYKSFSRTLPSFSHNETSSIDSTRLSRFSLLRLVRYSCNAHNDDEEKSGLYDDDYYYYE